MLRPLRRPRLLHHLAREPPPPQCGVDVVQRPSRGAVVTAASVARPARPQVPVHEVSPEHLGGGGKGQRLEVVGHEPGQAVQGADWQEVLGHGDALVKVEHRVRVAVRDVDGLVGALYGSEVAKCG